MLRRAALLLAVLAFDWLAFMPIRLGYAPPHTSLGRLLFIYGPTVLLCAVSVAVALRRGVHTRADLGLETTEYQRRHRIIGWRYALALLGLFLAGALTHMLPPVNYSLVHGLSYAEFIELVRGNEWRACFARSLPPVDGGDIALVFAQGVVLAPLVEETVYRALFVPTVFGTLGRFGTAAAAGVLFHGVHVVIYGMPAHPSYFLVGAALAYVFYWFGLRGALAAHAGCNFGLLLLALLVEFQR
jgi:membrane protease YdiL (CAAX protease family)